MLSDPRVQVVFDDARHFLATTREKFDVITSDPIHPWVRGNSILFSREYYAIVKAPAQARAASPRSGCRCTRPARTPSRSRCARSWTRSPTARSGTRWRAARATTWCCWAATSRCGSTSRRSRSASQRTRASAQSLRDVKIRRRRSARDLRHERPGHAEVARGRAGQSRLQPQARVHLGPGAQQQGGRPDLRAHDRRHADTRRKSSRRRRSFKRSSSAASVAAAVARGRSPAAPAVPHR